MKETERLMYQKAPNEKNNLYLKGDLKMGKNIFEKLKKIKKL